MIARGDNISLGLVLGVGCLQLTHGLGSCTGIPLVPESVPHAKDGGAAPTAHAVGMESPRVLSAGVVRDPSRRG